MSNPKHTLFWMTLFLGVVVIVGALIHKPLISAFMANWVFNLLILGVLIIGIALTYRQVFVLFPELKWIAQFRTGHAGLSVVQEPKLLKPLARQLGEDATKDRFTLSTLSLRTVLDGIHSRMDEQREITRYFISLLVFLGLLLAGKTPVMLNFTTGPANLASALEKMEIRQVVTSQAFLDRLGLELIRPGPEWTASEDLYQACDGELTGVSWDRGHRKLLLLTLARPHSCGK